jgi:hypothetical protein
MVVCYKPFELETEFLCIFTRIWRLKIIQEAKVHTLVEC